MVVTGMSLFFNSSIKMLPSCLCVTSPHQLDFSENVTDGSEAFCKLAIEVTRLQTNSYGHFFIYFCFWRINIIITGIYFFFAYRGIHKLGLLIIKSIIIVNPTQVKQSRNCKIRFFYLIVCNWKHLWQTTLKRKSLFCNKLKQATCANSSV